MLICQGWSFQGLPSNQVRKAQEFGGGGGGGGGKGELPYKSDRVARQKIKIKPLRETSVGVDQT